MFLMEVKKQKINWQTEISPTLRFSLEKQIISSKIASSYLFYGPGGKNELARELAKIILCQGDVKPCKGQCCQIFELGIHPDFIIIEKEADATQIKIERIREVIRRISLKSTGRRIVLLKNAELLSIDAANALLKTLEEPPAETTFILTASDIKQVIPTIISRCQGYYLEEKKESKKCDREKEIKDFLCGDLVRRFQFAEEVSKIKDGAPSVLNGIERFLRREMFKERNLSERKRLAFEIKKVTAFRLLLKRNISARLILEDLSLRLKRRK